MGLYKWNFWKSFKHIQYAIFLHQASLIASIVSAIVLPIFVGLLQASLAVSIPLYALCGVISIALCVYSLYKLNVASNKAEELQLQTALDAQEYYVNGPANRALLELNRMREVYQWGNREIELLGGTPEPNDSDQREREIHKIQAAFHAKKQDDPRLAARIVIKLFKGERNDIGISMMINLANELNNNQER